METKEIRVGTKTFNVHELLATEFDEIQLEDDATKRVVATTKKSADLSDADYAKLTLRERSAIQRAMSILNGWVTDDTKGGDSDFPKPAVPEKSKS